MYRGLMTVNGKKVALPFFLFFKFAIASLAQKSSFTKTKFLLAAIAISKALA